MYRFPMGTQYTERFLWAQSTSCNLSRSIYWHFHCWQSLRYNVQFSVSSSSALPTKPKHNSRLFVMHSYKIIWWLYFRDGYGYRYKHETIWKQLGKSLNLHIIYEWRSDPYQIKMAS
jgi:hypothetical protein